MDGLAYQEKVRTEWRRRCSVGMNAAIAERAVTLRRQHRLKLPDAIVWASAQVQSMALVTRDAKAFPPDDPGVRMPYRIAEHPA
jgi:predicted nucleic acid-binding protein